MPTIYLSPSLQEFNPYVGGGNEEYYMNLVADAMEPYLRASGIDFVRNDPEMTLRQAINDSNAGNYDLHLALHSNASPASTAGQNQGADVYYYTTSQNGKRLADIIANNYEGVYPRSVDVLPTTSLAEVRDTRAPAVLIETAFHDNTEDANWIRNNIDNIARSLSQSVAEYLGVPFVNPSS